jgi:hypothetical protein
MVTDSAESTADATVSGVSGTTADDVPDSDADVPDSDADVPDSDADVPDSDADVPDGDAEGTDDTGSGPDARSVTVPTRVYKSVTVFSTLFAVVTVVGGFIALDVATERASVSLAEADPLLALAGLALIVLGAVTYAFSTRFQAEEMGNAKDDDDEQSNNG